MKKAFTAVIGLLLVFAFVLLACNLNLPTQKSDPDDEWPTGYPSEDEIRYDENGNPMKKLAIQVSGGDLPTGARGLDLEVAQLCINWFEVEIIAGDGNVYSAAGAAHENLPQTPTTLHLWLPYTMPNVIVGNWEPYVLCYGGYRRRTADGSIDYTLLALGQCTRMKKENSPVLPIATDSNLVAREVEELYFEMTALQFDINARNHENFKRALEWSATAGNNNSRMDLLPHGAFWIQNPYGWNTLDDNNFHTYQTDDGTIVPYFELPPNRSLANFTDHDNIRNVLAGRHPHARPPTAPWAGYDHICVARLWIEGLLKTTRPYPLTNHPDFMVWGMDPPLLTTTPNVASGFVYTSHPVHHNYVGEGGTGFYVAIETGAKGWAMISAEVNITTRGGVTWLVRNGMYLWVPDTGIANGSLGGGILIRVCDKDDPLTATPLTGAPYALGNILPEQYMPRAGWEPDGWPPPPPSPPWLWP